MAIDFVLIKESTFLRLSDDPWSRENATQPLNYKALKIFAVTLSAPYIKILPSAGPFAGVASPLNAGIIIFSTGDLAVV